MIYIEPLYINGNHMSERITFDMYTMTCEEFMSWYTNVASSHGQEEYRNAYLVVKYRNTSRLAEILYGV